MANPFPRVQITNAIVSRNPNTPRKLYFNKDEDESTTLITAYAADGSPIPSSSLTITPPIDTSVEGITPTTITIPSEAGYAGYDVDVIVLAKSAVKPPLPCRNDILPRIEPPANIKMRFEPGEGTDAGDETFFVSILVNDPYPECVLIGEDGEYDTTPNILVYDDDDFLTGYPKTIYNHVGYNNDTLEFTYTINIFATQAELDEYDSSACTISSPKSKIASDGIAEIEVSIDDNYDTGIAFGYGPDISLPPMPIGTPSPNSDFTLEYLTPPDFNKPYNYVYATISNVEFDTNRTICNVFRLIKKAPSGKLPKLISTDGKLKETADGVMFYCINQGDSLDANVLRVITKDGEFEETIAVVFTPEDSPYANEGVFDVVVTTPTSDANFSQTVKICVGSEACMEYSGQVGDCDNHAFDPSLLEEGKHYYGHHDAYKKFISCDQDNLDYPELPPSSVSWMAKYERAMEIHVAIRPEDVMEQQYMLLYSIASVLTPGGNNTQRFTDILDRMNEASDIYSEELLKRGITELVAGQHPKYKAPAWYASLVDLLVYTIPTPNRATAANVIDFTTMFEGAPESLVDFLTTYFNGL